MDTYKNKSREELLNICKEKLLNGRTYEELTCFLNRHDIDNTTQKYIFEELEKYEEVLKNTPRTKKQMPFTPVNMVIGVVLIALGTSVLMINSQGQFYFFALLIAIIGIGFIGFEIIKVFINLLR